MVISNVILVVAMNVAAKKNPDSLFFGYWQEENSDKAANIKAKMAYQNNLALVPLARANTAVDVDTKEGDVEFLSPINGQMMVATTSPTMKDPEEDGGVEIYKVKDGDTLSSIAAKYKITLNTILWANDIENVDSIMPGDEIFILPVSGLNYVVKKGDSIDNIAKKYKAEKSRIIAFNDLPANGELSEGQEIVIPDGEKEEAPSGSTSTRSGSGLIARKEYTPASAVSGWRKLEGKAGAGHKFPYGYCTWYVAQRRYVPWGGNAGTWLYHAKALGYKTGKSPAVGSIIVTTDSAYYGHVAIVERVNGDTITISEMNYRGWGVVNKRDVSVHSRKIKGFIY